MSFANTADPLFIGAVAVGMFWLPQLATLA